MRELGRTYEGTRTRMCDLVASSGDAAASIPVPACPGWSVHDVLAHVTGVCSDILQGNIAGAATDAWTAAQVESRRGWTTPEVVAEWDDVGPKIAGMLDDFPGRYGAQLVSDLAAHEHDIRGALGEPGARDSEAVAVALDFLNGVVAHAEMVARGLGPLEVRAGDRTWQAGTGEPATGERDAWRRAVQSAAADPRSARGPVATLEADPFELFRALMGRRSAAQIRRFSWTGDPDTYLPIFDAGPFTRRETDLEE